MPPLKNTEKSIIKMITWRGDNFIIQHLLRLALLTWILRLHGSRLWAGWPDSPKQRAAATLCNSQSLSTLLRESCKPQQDPFILDNYLSSKVIRFCQILEFWFAWADCHVGDFFFFNLQSDSGTYSILLKKTAHFISFTCYDSSFPLLAVQNMQCSQKAI